ncbi:MAG: aminotransferase [Prevotella pallens]|uniref:aminotransferase n=1 Tax=Prevotella pallens TaxID=60133 RepID=UPI001CAE48B8|nr:aminotransferase [Prevotella pallens]MBF1497535.1 aminotransferase [Prevotella pallens]
MKKIYLEPETKVYEQKVEGHLLAGTGVEGSTTDPKQGGDPTSTSTTIPNPFNSEAKEETKWYTEE